MNAGCRTCPGIIVFNFLSYGLHSRMWSTRVYSSSSIQTIGQCFESNYTLLSIPLRAMEAMDLMVSSNSILNGDAQVGSVSSWKGVVNFYCSAQPWMFCE